MGAGQLGEMCHALAGINVLVDVDDVGMRRCGVVVDGPQKLSAALGKLAKVGLDERHPLGVVQIVGEVENEAGPDPGILAACTVMRGQPICA